MSDAITKVHALSAFMSSEGAAKVADPGVRVALKPFVTHVTIRGNPLNDEFASAVHKVLGLALPGTGTVVRGDHSLYWLGPKEYLVITDQIDSVSLVSRLSDAFAEIHASATDLSGGQLLMTVSGSAARDFLSKASTLDLHASGFNVNNCAQSTFAKTAALFALRANDPVFELVIRRSFVDYAAKWMSHAGQEFGIVFSE